MYPRIVRQMLIRRSQPQPVMKNAAAGGKRIATIMRQMSEPRTVIIVVDVVGSVFCRCFGIWVFGERCSCGYGGKEDSDDNEADV